MLKFLKSFREFIGYGLLLLTILWFPKDVLDSGEALAPWRKMLSIVSQNQALWVFAIAALAYIFWIDARPYYRHWADKKWPKVGSPIKLRPQIYVESLHFDGLDKMDNLWANDFYLIVENDLNDASVLSHVQCRLYFANEVSLSTVKETLESSADIRHGEIAMFKIGRIATSEPIGKTHFSGEKLDAGMQKAYDHNIPIGHLSFEVWSHPNKRSFGLSSYPDNKIIWEISAAISANNVHSKKIILERRTVN